MKDSQRMEVILNQLKYPQYQKGNTLTLSPDLVVFFKIIQLFLLYIAISHCHTHKQVGRGFEFSTTVYNFRLNLAGH